MSGNGCNVSIWTCLSNNKMLGESCDTTHSDLQDCYFLLHDETLFLSVRAHSEKETGP